MKTFFQLREENSGETLKVTQDIFEAAQQLMLEEAGKLTMHTHDGEETHVIHNMKHTDANAKKVRTAVGKAAAKHAGVSHSDMDDYYGGDHHYKADEAHKSSKPAGAGAQRYGGHGSIVHHKTMADYVKHHAKDDSEMYDPDHAHYG